jgi:hypothetical protein
MMVINPPLYQCSTQFALVVQCPFYNHTTQIALALLQTTLRDFIGGVKIRVALRQIAVNHWPHLGPTMYLP